MIKRLEFSTDIDATKSNIWNALWNDNNYRQWAGAFYAGSYIKVENWEVGSTVHFLGSDNTGIYSMVEKHIPNSFIQFKHIGNVMDGAEQPLDAETKKWSGTTEIYEILEEDGFNTLRVSLDVMEEHIDFMMKSFPNALDVIKRNSEEVTGI